MKTWFFIRTSDIGEYLMKRTSRTLLWILGSCAVVLLTVLFLYQRPFTETDTTLGKDSQETPATEFSTGQQPNAEAPAEGQESTHQQRTSAGEVQNTEADRAQVTEALDFLETLEEQSLSENGSEDTHATNNTSDLTQEELFQLVREGVAYYDSLLESASVEFHIQTTSADFPFEPLEGISRLPSGTWTGSLTFSHGRLRGEVTENKTQYDAHGAPTVFRGTEQFAYDGETFQTYRHLPTGPLVSHSSTPSYDTSVDPRVWGWSLSTEWTLTDILNLYDIEHIQTVPGDTGDLYHLTGSYGGHVKVDLWLNPEKSYRPERYVTSIPGDQSKHIDTWTTYQYQEVAPDLWFPKSAEYVVTAANLDTGVETDVKRTTVRFSNLRVNERIPSHRFTLEAPAGTSFYDARTRESFKTSKEDN